MRRLQWSASVCKNTFDLVKLAITKKIQLFDVDHFH